MQLLQGMVMLMQEMEMLTRRQTVTVTLTRVLLGAARQRGREERATMTTRGLSLTPEEEPTAMQAERTAMSQTFAGIQRLLVGATVTVQMQVQRLMLMTEVAFVRTRETRFRTTQTIGDVARAIQGFGIATIQEGGAALEAVNIFAMVVLPELRTVVQRTVTMPQEEPVMTGTAGRFQTAQQGTTEERPGTLPVTRLTILVLFELAVRVTLVRGLVQQALVRA